MTSPKPAGLKSAGFFISYLLVCFQPDIAQLASRLQDLGNTLDGELKVKAIDVAQVLCDLSAKQDAIDRFIGLKVAAKQAADG